MCTFPPLAFSLLSSETVSARILDGECRELIFSDESPLLDVSSRGAFADKNPGLLYLTVGNLDDTGLKESWLACRTTSAPMNPKWKMIASKLKAKTTAGAVAFNPIDGSSSVLRNHRFTNQAKALSEKGVPILPSAGSSRIRLGAIE